MITTTKKEYTMTLTDDKITDTKTGVEATPPTPPTTRVTITATRLKTLLTTVVRANKDTAAAYALCDELLYGKDDSRSPIVSQIREIREELASAAPTMDGIPGMVRAVERDVREML